MALVVISFPALVAAQFLNILLVRDTFPSYSSSNYVVWHSPLGLHARLFSSSKHAFTGLWLCMTTAFGSVKVFPLSHSLPPRKINPLPWIRRRGWALTPRAVCNQHGVAAETPGDAAKHDMTQRHTETSQWILMAGCMRSSELSAVSYCRLNLTTAGRLNMHIMCFI